MADKPLISAAFTRYIESLEVVASYIALTRERVAQCIRDSVFPPHIIEAVCICKFVGTSFGVDAVSAIRKVMGAYALTQQSRLGASSFVCNATCAAEGDNTIMELKVVGDLVKGGLARMLPVGLLLRSFSHGGATRSVLARYVLLMVRAMALGKAAMQEGQLLRDIAWCRAHLLILDSWYTVGAAQYQKQATATAGGRNSKISAADLDKAIESYEAILMRFPTPVQF